MSQKPERPHSIAFDLDGVLINSSPAHRAAFEQVFKPFGIENFIYAEYAGQRTPDVIESVLRKNAVDFTPEMVTDLAAAKSRLAREQLAATSHVAPDCMPTLRKLAADYTLALASSGSRSSVQSFLDANHCSDLFQSILSGEDVTRAKPDPEIYERSFAALGTEPGHMVVVEDAVSGILASRAAGAGMTIGLIGTCSGEQLLAAGAQTVIRTLSEIPQVLTSVYEYATPN